MVMNQTNEIARSNFIVINDFRALPVMAALSIAKRVDHSGRVAFIVSKRFLISNDYGQYLPSSYKKIKLWWLSFFYKIIYVQCSDETLLLDEEQVGIDSSLKSITCDSLASNRLYPMLYRQLLEQSLGAAEVAKYLCSIEVPSKVFIFNGRTASSQPIVKRCHKSGINLTYYEYADSPFSGYRLYPYAPHSTTKLGKDLCNFRNYCIKSVPEIFIQGKAWEENKLNNPYTKSYSKVSNAQHDVIVFLGSDHEYTHLDEEIAGFKCIGNLGMAKAVIKKYGSDKNIAVRAHPNQLSDASYKTTLVPIMALCKQHGLIFYGPDSEISSYELIKNSTIVAVEYSSIAHDAVLLGAQVDIFGDLDLKVIIAQAPAHIREDASRLKNYVREILSLYNDLYFVRFQRYQALAARIVSIFEWRVLRCAKPPSSFLKSLK
jgi:hypothetical protein